MALHAIWRCRLLRILSARDDRAVPEFGACSNPWPDIVVLDHLPGSDWCFYAAQEDKVRCCAGPMDPFGYRRRSHETVEVY